MSHVLSAGLRPARCDLGIIAMPPDFPPNPFLVHRFHGGRPQGVGCGYERTRQIHHLGWALITARPLPTTIASRAGIGVVAGRARIVKPATTSTDCG